MADEKKIALSFGFSKKTESVKLKASAISDGEVKDKEERDYLVSVEDLKINSVKPVEKKAPLVIELIQNNRWRHGKRPEDLEADDTSVVVTKANCHVQQTGDNATDTAVKELLEDAARLNEEAQTSAIDTSFSIPLLMQNKVPEGFETDERLDVALRPDEATSQDYEKVPIEQFGLAILRGMGWKDGEGIGKKKEFVKPLDPVIRPKGLGLGADKSAAQQSKDKAPKSNEEAEQEQLTLKTGAYCKVINGKRDGQYGTISGIDCENSRVMISMTVDTEVISVSQFAVKLVSKKEFDKFSKYLNKSKVDRFKEERDERNSSKQDNPSRHGDHSKQSSSSRRENGDSSRKQADHNDSKSRRKDDYADKEDEYSSQNKSNATESGTSRKRKQQDDYASSSKKANCLHVWLRPHLRVKVVDKSYRKGKYYRSKVNIVDVISNDACICRTDDGRVLEDLVQSQLETVIPHQPSSSTYVMVVAGKHKAQIAQLIERDNERSRVIVQLLSDRNVALTLDFDDVCEYAADVAVDDFDY